MAIFQRDAKSALTKKNIYEVWGDVVEDAAQQGCAVLDAIYMYLDQSAWYNEEFSQELCCDGDGQPENLFLQQRDIAAAVYALPLGRHLNVYAVLWLRRGLLDQPDPMARIAELDAHQRRELQVFQTLLKRAMEEALDALDEGRLPGQYA